MSTLYDMSNERTLRNLNIDLGKMKKSTNLS